MAYTQTNLLLRYTNRLATGPNDAGSSIVDASNAHLRSLGDWISAGIPTDATLGNLFRAITPAECASGITLYRCLGLANIDTQLPVNPVYAWFSATSGGGTIKIALDPRGVQSLTSGTAQFEETTVETTRPVNIPAGNFVNTPLSRATALLVGNLTAGTCAGLWLELTVAPGTAQLNPDSTTIHLEATG